MIQQELMKLLQDFSAISLDQLNSSAKFMERIETKYILDKKQIKAFFKKALKKYYILQMNNKLMFAYKNTYMDTKDYLFYHQHEQKKDKRIKLRTRQYVESGDSFVEYKQKEGRLVRKFRYQCPTSDYGKMTDNAHKFYAKLMQDFNTKHSKKIVSPSLATNYQRITLCSRNSDERVTVDFNIHLEDLRNTKAEPKKLDHFAIVESKSTNDKCTSHRIMKKIGVRPAKNCSKYCLGIYYFKRAKSWKTFQRTIANIEKMKQKALPHPITFTKQKEKTVRAVAA